MTEPPYAQLMGKILLMAMEEVLGDEGLRSVIASAGQGPPARTGSKKDRAPALDQDGVNDLTPASWGMSRLLTSLERVYGLQAGQGIAQRVGRAFFPYGLREYGDALGLTQTTFRLLPFPSKLAGLSAALAGLLHQHTDQHVSFEKSGGKLLWHIEGCPMCRERHTHAPSCHFAVGFVEEALYWLSGGKIFQVEEIACSAQGDPRCSLQVDGSPLF